MSKNNDLRGNVGSLFTRAKSKALKNPETAQWVYPRTSREGRNFLTKRIDSYVNKEIKVTPDPKLIQEWKNVVKRGTLTFPIMLDFAIDKLKLKSVKRQVNYKSLSNVNKAKFLEPFNIQME